jgi:hypothetical protein
MSMTRSVFTLAAAAALLLAPPAQAQWTPAMLTSDELLALRSLCHIGLRANGGIWSSARINAAIATLAFGAEQPDGAQAVAYKVCNAAGGLGR